MSLTALRQERALWWPAALATLAWTLLWLTAYLVSGPGLGEAGDEPSRVATLTGAGRPQGLHLAQLAVWLGGLVVIGAWIETERRRARQGARWAQAWRESESRLDLLLKATEDLVLDADLSASAILHCSPALAEMLALPSQPSRPIFESWLDRVHADDKVALKAAIRRHLDGLTHRFEAEVRLPAGEGQTHWYLLRGRIQPDLQGRPQRLLAVFREIGGHKAHESALRLECARVREALAAVGEAVLCTDAEGRFVLYAQAVQPLAQDGERHYEVLVRMVSAQGHLVSPGLFVPVAERNGLMPAVDRWVIRRALEMLATTGDGGRGTQLFINLSGASLLDETLADFIREQMAQTGIEPAQLCFEVTETAAVAQLATGVRLMRALQGLGCRFALDDFGSGMSSFVYLKNLPVDFLKIDGVFVRDMEHDPVNHAFVETINRIGQLMGKRTIAEFVETEAIRVLLQRIGVDFVQGRLVGMPRPLDAVLKGL